MVLGLDAAALHQVGGESSGKGNAAQQALTSVQSSVEKGGFWQQYSAVLALRMTPVVPFRFESGTLSRKDMLGKGLEGVDRAHLACADLHVCIAMHVPIYQAYMSPTFGFL